MIDGEMIKDMAYKISLSAITVTVLFLSFAVFYLVGFDFIQSLTLALAISTVTFLTSKWTMRNLQKKEFQR